MARQEAQHAKVAAHTAGMFSWADLSTTDPQAAKAFYGDLFGWSYSDEPAGPNMEYPMALVEGETAAALFAQPPAHR